MYSDYDLCASKKVTYRFVIGTTHLMSGSCHLDRASNVEIGVECQIFVIVIFFNCSRVLQYEGTFKGAITQKRSFLVICTTGCSSHFGNPTNFKILKEPMLVQK
jgi:hypothetical protein